MVFSGFYSAPSHPDVGTYNLQITVQFYGFIPYMMGHCLHWRFKEHIWLIDFRFALSGGENEFNYNLDNKIGAAPILFDEKYFLKMLLKGLNLHRFVLHPNGRIFPHVG